jgi:hypothetical protein
MIGLLIRLAMGKDTNAFWIGLVMLLVGLGLTVASYTAALAIGGAGVVVFYGLMIGGVIRMVTAAPSLLSGHRETKRDVGPLFGPHGTPGQVVSGPILPSFMALPTEMPPGVCWQCGGNVKPGRVMCLHCGATLPVSGEQELSSAAQLAGFNPNISSSAIPKTVHTVTGPPGMYQSESDGQDYGGPPPGYGDSPPGYGGPPPEYSGRPPRRGGPPPGYGGPPPGYGGPPPGYGGPPPGYGDSPPGYGRPPPGYSGPPPGYGGPPSGYGGRPPRRSGPPPGYSGPPPGYGGPPPGYGGPPPGRGGPPPRRGGPPPGNSGRPPRRGGPPPDWDDPRQSGSPDRRRR